MSLFYCNFVCYFMQMLVFTKLRILVFDTLKYTKGVQSLIGTIGTTNHHNTLQRGACLVETFPWHIDMLFHWLKGALSSRSKRACGVHGINKLAHRVTARARSVSCRHDPLKTVFVFHFCQRFLYLVCKFILAWVFPGVPPPNRVTDSC